MATEFADEEDDGRYLNGGEGISTNGNYGNGVMGGEELDEAMTELEVVECMMKWEVKIWKLREEPVKENAV